MISFVKASFIRFRTWIASNPLWGLVLALAFVRLAMLATYPLMDTTEARYADIGQMMANQNDWITPWFRPNVPFWGKPPLSFWFTALSFKVFGANEFSARFAHWLLGIIAGCFVWDLGRRRSNREKAISIALLSGCLIYFFATGAVMTDMALTLGMVVSMWSFWLSVQGFDSGNKKPMVSWLFFLSLGWGLLAKGPLAIALTALALFSWLIFNRDFIPAALKLPWLRGSALTLLVSVPWYWAAEIKTPGFLNYFIIGEHLNRFLVPGWNGDLYGNAHHHAHGTIWLYLLYMLAPWTIIIPAFLFWQKGRFVMPIVVAGSVRGDSHDLAWRNYLLCWGLAPAIFFTFAGNIVMPYVLPGIPALALLGGFYLVRFEQRVVDKLLTVGLSILLVGSILFVFIFPLTGYGDRKSQRSLLKAYENAKSSQSHLVYWDQYPFSAGFYGRDRVRSVFKLEELRSELDKGDQLFIAVGRGDHFVLQAPGIAHRLELVKTFRRYALYREKLEPAGR